MPEARATPNYVEFTSTPIVKATRIFAEEFTFAVNLFLEVMASAFKTFLRMVASRRFSKADTLLLLRANLANLAGPLLSFAIGKNPN